MNIKMLLRSMSLCMTATISPLFIIGHRGACGYEPENTLRSFERAIDLGVPMIELDVHVCASGELVVIHDDTVDRTTNGQGAVAQLTWDQLRILDAGKGECIPQLFEVIERVNRRVIINIELKGPGTAAPVAQLIKQYIKKGWSNDDFVVSSFDHYAVLAFHELCSEVKTGAILEGVPVGHAEFAQRAHAAYAVVYYESATPELVEDAHQRGIQVLVYTVNDVEIARRMQQYGVDGIFTNYPDLF